MTGDQRDGAEAKDWAERRRQDLAEAEVLVGPGFLYRPEELLVAVPPGSGHAERVLRLLDGRTDGYSRYDEQLQALDLGVRSLHLDPAVDLPALLRELAAEPLTDEGPLRVAPNTVLAGEPPYMGGPGGPPRRSSPSKDGMRETGQEPEPGLAVLDTGWSTDLPDLHPGLLAALRADQADVDLLDLDGRAGLDTEAGHGTFICGLVRRLAPGLGIAAEQVLTPQGWGDDRTVSVRLATQQLPVINLSLGGYTPDDMPPLALERALHALGRDRVVVAAAGNHGSQRPFWPAASKHVLAVAALDTTGVDPSAAGFSNRGPWVDVCAPGVHVKSTFVRGSQDAGAGRQEFDGWACWSGTSFAAPIIAAAVAAAVLRGASPRAAAAGLLSTLSTLPGLEDFGVWYDPGVDLLCHEH